MLSPHAQSQRPSPEDYSLEDEFIDDIKPELISFTLTGSPSSSFNFEESSPNIENTLSYISSPVYTEKETSDSFFVILNTFSKEDELSSAETLLNHEDIKLLSPGDMSMTNNNESYVKNDIGVQLFDPLLGFNQYKHNDNVESTQSCTRLEESSTIASVMPRSKLSLSMNDVSKFPEFPLKKKSENVSSQVFESQSMTTVSSCQKSKDSGLPRSLSYLSLQNGSKSYDHIQSKVKEYIRQIKEKEENRKSKRMETVRKSNSFSSVIDPCSETNISGSDENLAIVVRELHIKLEDKEAVLSKLQENYDKLLLKYAEAENRIDHLRFKAIDSSLELPSKISNEEKLNKHLAFSLESRIEDIQTNIDLFNSTEVSTESYENLQPSPNLKSKELDSKSNLSPVVKIYSSSSRLNRKLVPLSYGSKVESFEHAIVPNSLKETLSPGNIFISKEWNSDLKINHTNKVVHKCMENSNECKANFISEGMGNNDIGTTSDSKNSNLEVHYEVMKESAEFIVNMSTTNLECTLTEEITKGSNSSPHHSNEFKKVS